MPKRQLDPKDRKNKPPKDFTKKARKGSSWVNVARVGAWEPVLAEETAVLTDVERKDDVKITRKDREAAKELERELGRAATKAEREARKAAKKAEKETLSTVVDGAQPTSGRKAVAGVQGA